MNKDHKDKEEDQEYSLVEDSEVGERVVRHVGALILTVTFAFLVAVPTFVLVKETEPVRIALLSGVSVAFICVYLYVMRMWLKQ